MRNGNVQRIRVLIASLVAVIAAMADIYIIVNAPKNYILLAVLSAVLLVAIFFLVSGKMQLRDQSSQKAEEQYQNIVTSQKACYLQTRKKFRETGEMLSELDKKIEPLASSNENNYKQINGLLNSLMEDQKKLAKLTLSRSKENANALMNSNDKVMEEMAKVQEVVGTVLGQPENMIAQEENNSEEFGKIEEKQQELLTKMQALEDSLKSQMDIVVDKVQEIPGVGRELVEELKSEIKANEQKQQVIEEPEPIEEDINIEEPEPMEESADVEEPESLEEDTNIEEPELLEEDTNIEESEMTIQETELEPQEEVLAETELEIEPEPEIEEVETEQGSVIEEVVAEEKLEPENIAPQQPAMDTNKILTPEEIAALIAGNQEEELPESVEPPVEEESINEEVTEEAPPMPDLSDPNKKMSPEEIAALIANL